MVRYWGGAGLNTWSFSWSDWIKYFTLSGVYHFHDKPLSLNCLRVQICRLSNDSSKVLALCLSYGFSSQIKQQQQHCVCFMPNSDDPSLLGWVVMLQLCTCIYYVKFWPDFQEGNSHLERPKKGQQDFCSQIRIYFLVLEIQSFSSFFGKNSNWVKYRNSPFLPFIYFSICVRASSMMTAGNGLALELWVVSYLLWGSSWESIYTCHSRAILQRGLPSGLSPFAKAVLAVDADYSKP